MNTSPHTHSGIARYSHLKRTQQFYEFIWLHFLLLMTFGFMLGFSSHCSIRDEADVTIIYKQNEPIRVSTISFPLYILHTIVACLALRMWQHTVCCALKCLVIWKRMADNTFKFRHRGELFKKRRRNFQKPIASVFTFFSLIFRFFKNLIFQ